MQLKSKLIQLLPIQSGTGKNGLWRKQDMIVETEGQYSKKICVSVWGDKIDESKLEIGNQLVIDFDIESRQYNGKWYTDIKAFKIEVENAKSSVFLPINGPIDSEFDKEEDVLPF